MKPRFPYPGNYYISQYFKNDTLGYVHYGIDIVPLDKPGGNHWPAPIFPVLGGKTLSVSNSDKDRGKGIKVRTLITPSFQKYLADKGYPNVKYVDCLYWHCLMVTDLDGNINQNTPVAITGNTGFVIAGGKPVPDYQKGVPPYPGLHLHLECELDQYGRIDPLIILNYPGDKMEFKTQSYKGELRVIPDKFAATDMDDWKAICKVLDLDPNKIDEVIN